MFDQIYSQASDALKLSFLGEAFSKYPQLREDFISFYLKPRESQLNMTVIDPDDFILASVDLIKEDLESFDFDEPDWHRLVYRHRSFHEGRVDPNQPEEDHLNGIVLFHIGLLEGYCTQKLFDLAFLYAVSLYQACYEVDLTDHEDILDDLRSILIDMLEQNLHSCLPLFKSIQLSADQLFTVATAVFDHFQLHQSKDAYFLAFFEPFLHATIHSGAEAAIVLDVVEAHHAADNVPWLYMELQRKAGGQQAWEKSALRFYRKNRSVANSLLEFYLSSDRTEFVRIAGELWRDGLFQDEFAQLYFEGMELSDNPQLYREVVLHLNRRRFSEVYYKALMELMNEEERMTYLETFQRDKPAYVLGLCLEEKYTEALRIADEYCNRWNLVDIMLPCLMHQPRATLEVLEAKIEELLVGERGPDFYERVTSVLFNASEISEIQQDVSKLIQRLYSRYGKLRGFGAELRHAGLIDF